MNFRQENTNIYLTLVNCILNLFPYKAELILPRQETHERRMCQW